MSEEQVVRNCAPTLAGLKTGNLFACPYENREDLLDFLRSLNRGTDSPSLLPYHLSKKKRKYRPSKNI